jgi:hypothetical protein
MMVFGGVIGKAKKAWRLVKDRDSKVKWRMRIERARGGGRDWERARVLREALKMCLRWGENFMWESLKVVGSIGWGLVWVGLVKCGL